MKIEFLFGGLNLNLFRKKKRQKMPVSWMML